MCRSPATSTRTGATPSPFTDPQSSGSTSSTNSERTTLDWALPSIRSSSATPATSRSSATSTATGKTPSDCTGNQPGWRTTATPIRKATPTASSPSAIPAYDSSQETGPGTELIRRVSSVLRLQRCSSAIRTHRATPTRSCTAAGNPRCPSREASRTAAARRRLRPMNAKRTASARQALETFAHQGSQPKRTFLVEAIAMSTRRALRSL